MFISLNFWEQALQCVCVCFLIFLSLFCSLILFISSNILFMLLPIFSILLQGVEFHTLSIGLFLMRDQMVDPNQTLTLVLVSVYFRYVQRRFQLFLRSEKFLKPLNLLPVFVSIVFVCVCMLSRLGWTSVEKICFFFFECVCVFVCVYKYVFLCV